jgi:hypothetical protein
MLLDEYFNAIVNVANATVILDLGGHKWVFDGNRDGNNIGLHHSHNLPIRNVLKVRLLEKA